MAVTMGAKSRGAGAKKQSESGAKAERKRNERTVGLQSYIVKIEFDRSERKFKLS